MGITQDKSPRDVSERDDHRSLDGVLPVPPAREEGPGEVVRAPRWHDVQTSFAVVPASRMTLAHVDEVRRSTAGEAAVAILYDVSPPGLSAQQLFNELGRYPKIVLCDHHNGAAPSHEVPGREVTAAEMIVATLPALWSKGLLRSSDGAACAIVGITNTMNIDPDSIICRLLIDSFSNPAMREVVWDSGNSDILVRAARFGDTTFFGGIDIESAQYDQLGESERIACAILKMISEERGALVADSCFAAATMRTKASEVFHAAHPQGSSVAEQIAFLRQTASQEDLCAWLEKGGVHVDSLVRDSLRSIKDKAAAQALDEDRLFNDVFHEEKKSFVLAHARRSDIRSVFGAADASCNEVAIGRMFESLSNSLYDVLRHPARYRPHVEEFLRELREVHSAAQARSRTVEDKITITTAVDGLDRAPHVAHLERKSPVHDWLREAAASFGAPWLHIMDRRGHIVVSGRFSKPGETRPEINLAHPDVVAALRGLEEAAFERARAHSETVVSESPTPILVKSNLWLPLHKNHYTVEEVRDLLLKHYDTIVSAHGAVPPQSEEATYPAVTTSEGTQIPFSGSYHFERASR